jgi:hypothetical protein
MPNEGDKPKQTAFDFVELEQANEPPTRRASPDLGKRARQRERGRAKESAAKSRTRIRNSDAPTPEQPPHTTTKRPWPSIRGKTWPLLFGLLTLVGTGIALYCAPPQIEDATEWYRKRFPKQNNSDTAQKPTAPSNPLDEVSPTTTGSIDGPPAIGTPIREKTIASAVALLGEGSYEEQTKKYEAHLKGQLIVDPGWKGIVDGLTEFREVSKQWCMTVRRCSNSGMQL